MLAAQYGMNITDVIIVTGRAITVIVFLKGSQDNTAAVHYQGVRQGIIRD
jgi:hypothetical protein